MTNMRNLLILSSCMLISCISIVASAIAEEKDTDEAWKQAKQLHRDRSFAFVDRRLNCSEGKIVHVTEQAVTLKRPDNTKTTIDRQDLLRLSVVGSRAGGILYSGRSSWADIKALFRDSTSYRREKVRLFTQDRKGHVGELIDADDSHLEVLASGQKVQFAKSNISKIYFITIKQLNDKAEEVFQEDPWLAIFDPEAWPIILGGGRIPVLLFDSSKTEDNGAIECEKN
jgi:hypothetical protein